MVLINVITVGHAPIPIEFFLKNLSQDDFDQVILAFRPEWLTEGRSH